MSTLLIIFLLINFMDNVAAEEEWIINFTKLDCTVESSAGFFNAYSVPPSHGDKIDINLNSILLEERAILKFKSQKKSSGPEPYIPYPEPFKLKNDRVSPKLKYMAKRYVSGEGTDYSVTLDISNGAHWKPNQIKASILVEGDVVLGICFLNCKIIE